MWTLRNSATIWNGKSPKERGLYFRGYSPRPANSTAFGTRGGGSPDFWSRIRGNRTYTPGIPQGRKRPRGSFLGNRNINLEVIRTVLQAADGNRFDEPEGMRGDAFSDSVPNTDPQDENLKIKEVLTSFGAPGAHRLPRALNSHP